MQAAQAALDMAGQAIGVKTAAIKSAAAGLGDERAQLNPIDDLLLLMSQDNIPVIIKDGKIHKKALLVN